MSYAFLIRKVYMKRMFYRILTTRSDENLRVLLHLVWDRSGVSSVQLGPEMLNPTYAHIGHGLSPQAGNPNVHMYT